MKLIPDLCPKSGLAQLVSWKFAAHDTLLPLFEAGPKAYFRKNSSQDCHLPTISHLLPFGIWNGSGIPDRNDPGVGSA